MNEIFMNQEKIRKFIFKYSFIQNKVAFMRLSSFLILYTIDRRFYFCGVNPLERDSFIDSKSIIKKEDIAYIMSEVHSSSNKYDNYLRSLVNSASEMIFFKINDDYAWNNFDNTNKTFFYYNINNYSFFNINNTNEFRTSSNNISPGIIISNLNWMIMHPWNNNFIDSIIIKDETYNPEFYELDNLTGKK